jgi:RNA ligase (TIGR02306 family)
MSQWKVSKEIIEIFPHPNADAIELAKVGDLQLVVGKGIYKTGDCVLVLPYKTVLSGNETIHASQDFKYLGGSAHDRVIEHTMRGEISQGANVPIHIVHNSLVNAGLSEMASAFWDAELGVDISELLNLTKYEPPIPVNLTGVVERMTAPFIEHDAVQFGISLPKLLGKYISVTEKLHGCQLNVSCDVKSGEIKVTTKGLGEREQQFKEHSPYVQGAIDRSGILEAFPRLINNFTAVGNMLVNAKKELVSVQAIGELT